MTTHDIEIRKVPIGSDDAHRLILALNAELSALYPEDGTACHFRLDDDEVAEGRGAFFVAYANDGPLACGAIRRVDSDTAEIKRMYVQPPARGLGVGRRLLRVLEEEARSLGAKRLALETGVRQPDAIALYTGAGFARIPAFGEYEEHPLSVFMAKDVALP
jgi:GNAT superfamily N-acetyltransferase